LSLQVRPGELYGFLGQNGAGKTTTIRMLAGLLQPSEGEVRIVGMNYAEHGSALRRRVGLVPDTPPLYDYLTGRQYLALVASLWQVGRRERDERAERLFDLLQLTDIADDLCKSYSHGTRKKVHVAAVLATAPDVLLLDEPTTGLDPLSTRRLKDLLRAEAARGAAVLLSTHVLETAEQICHRVGILAAGTLRAEGTADELRVAHGGGTLEDVFLRLTEAPAKSKS
ncbi:MAG: hypothetical protein RL398_3032, partial [Planctomycetota bacterium]